MNLKKTNQDNVTFPKVIFFAKILGKGGVCFGLNNFLSYFCCPLTLKLSGQAQRKDR